MNYSKTRADLKTCREVGEAMIDLNELNVHTILRNVGTVAEVVKHVFLYIINR